MRGWYPVTIDNNSFFCDPEHIPFWQKVNAGHWEPQTFAVLNRLLTKKSIYCDVGAWIGPTVLYAAKRCRKVYCLEPDRVAYQYLLQNIQLNSLENIFPSHLALSSKNGLSMMSSPRGKRGDSMTSLIRPDGKRGQEVLCLVWQQWLELVGVPRFDIIKMDIEGGEFALLPTMQDYLVENRPKLLLSLHPHLLPETERLEEMSRLADILSFYGACYDSGGNRLKLLSLQDGQAVRSAGTYLLLPE
jgi:FkbM family methyltransferase